MEQSRRDFLRGATAAGVGLAFADEAWAKPVRSANEKVAFACIGVGGKGESDSNDAGKFGDVVAICDVDENTLAKAKGRFPNAKTYTDYRTMFDEMGKSIDAVTVSTPDHHHAIASTMAMKMGKHCFCQKPLAHSIWEARQMGEIARKAKVATQMGNQGTAGGGLRSDAMMIKKGVLGTVTEVHVWTNRPIWPQGIERKPEKPVPSQLHWDEWIGPAPMRPYAEGYHDFAWRGWWDFGTGALGDMACHTVNMPYMALDLRYPTSVVATSSGNNKDSYPSSSQITFEFAATKDRPAVKMIWYDGGKMPPAELFEGTKPSDSGSLVIGSKGKMYTGGDYGGGGKLLGGASEIEVDYVRSPGHFQEFIRAIKEKVPATSNFPDYAGPLTETILLGNLAVWAEGKKIEWDAKNLRAKNAPEVAKIIKPDYRKGWSI